jgi:general secretion pathway protein K
MMPGIEKKGGSFADHNESAEARGSQRGMAVIMALSMVLLLASAALELHMSERSNLLNAAALRDRLTLEQTAAAGVHAAMALLIKDRLESETDSLQEDWADPDILAGLAEEIPFEQGTLEVHITDEMGKIQINSLVRFPEGRHFNEAQHRMWERFASGLLAMQEDLDESAVTTIINSIKDWLDSGDDDAITGLSGAESDYYESLDPPYSAKNGPFDDLSEVRLVKGITPEIFNGVGGTAGLGAYVTVYGAEAAGDEGFTFPGRININTAELPVLAALLPIEAAGLAPMIVEYRAALSGNQFSHDLTNVNWIKNVPGLSEVQIDPSLVTVSSNMFRIVAVARLDEARSAVTAVVQRLRPSETEPWQCKILNWKTQ